MGPDALVFFVNGAVGDQAPVPRNSVESRWQRVADYGAELAEEAWRLWKTAQPTESSRFSYHTETIELPERRPHPEFLRLVGGEIPIPAAAIAPLLAALFPAHTSSTSVWLGDVLIVGVPGELSADLGRELRSRIQARHGTQRVLIGGLADEWISYMLTPDAYRLGGYEAAFSFYGESLGPIIVEGAIRGALATP